MERMLTAEEVAELLHVAIITIYKWTSEDRIPHVHLSLRCVRYPTNLIQEWILRNTHVVGLKEAEKEIRSRKEAVRRKYGASRSDVDGLIERAKREVMGGNQRDQ